MKEFLYKCVIGIAVLIDVFAMMYIVSPIDSLFKLLLYSIVAYLVAMYVALYMRNKNVGIKAVGADFYETVGT
jgi:hypothetical protein